LIEYERSLRYKRTSIKIENSLKHVEASYEEE